jgi:hypothetical protein
MPNPGRGVWYAIAGTGDPIRVTTNHLATNYPTALNVIKGCGGDCVEHEDDFVAVNTNPFARTITFDSEEGVSYRIFVHGETSSDVGNFVVSAESFARPPNDQCTAAIPLTVGAAAVPAVTTEYASLDSRCGGEPRRGIWYAIAGNGERLEVTTCHAGTNYQFNLHVQTDCKSHCTNVQQSQTFGCNTNPLATTVKFDSIHGRTYFVFVSTPDSSAFGNVQIRADVDPDGPLIQTCDQVPCTNFLGMNGNYVHRDIAGRCFHYCAVFPGLLTMESMGWDCGPCP